MTGARLRGLGIGKSVHFTWIGAECGASYECSKYIADVDGRKLAKEVLNDKAGRHVSFYWEDKKPVYETLELALSEGKS